MTIDEIKIMVEEYIKRLDSKGIKEVDSAAIVTKHINGDVILTHATKFPVTYITRND